jgi:hypothetical protein
MPWHTVVSTPSSSDQRSQSADDRCTSMSDLSVCLRFFLPSWSVAPQDSGQGDSRKSGCDLSTGRTLLTNRKRCFTPAGVLCLYSSSFTFLFVTMLSYRALNREQRTMKAPSALPSTFLVGYAYPRRIRSIRVSNAGHGLRPPSIVCLVAYSDHPTARESTDGDHPDRIQLFIMA